MPPKNLSGENKKDGSSVFHLFFKGIILMFAVKLAYRLFFVGWHMYLLLHPDKVKDPFALAATKAGVQDTCSSTFKEIVTMRNVHSFDEVKKIAKLYDEPILFKGFVQDIAQKWAIVEENSKNVNVTFADVKITSFGNVFMKGIEVHDEVTLSLAQVWEAAKSDRGGKSFFASFVPFLSKESMKLVLNSDSSDSIKIDTNFVSNFAEDVLATHIHFALVKSYSVQLVGSKFWVFMPPSSLESYEPISTPTLWMLKGSEKEYFESMPAVPYVVQEPGDFLYFPPAWGHAVVTKAGPNVMLNMRELGGPELLYKYPLRALESKLCLVLQEKGEIKPFSHAKYTPIQETFRSYDKKHRNENKDRRIPESPCAGLWKDLLNGRK